MARNILGEQTSPYLRQHRDNPVHWQVWGEEAFAVARRENKPVLLSVGYAACHWCHVMAHESFEDGETAALMNELFVNVKVDREERPDVDLIYQNAVALLGEQGGWPLTVFLTPEGEPFWGGTYFPRERRFGRPAFTDVLRAIAEVHRREPERVKENAAAIRAALARLGEAEGAGEVTLATIDEAAGRLLAAFDLRHGGIGGAPKFPQAPVFELLWRAYLRTGDARMRNAVEVTLDRMCQGGIYDHLGGGFARYSTDAEWLVPHFEKMLYDNAQLIDLLTLVWRGTGNPLYAARVHETVAWLLREMRVEGGAFAGTLDADSEGEEGRFYVWEEAEVDRVLGEDAEPFKRVYDVTAGGNWEGRNILNRRGTAAPLGEAEEAALARSRERLFRARERRVRPTRDDKVLADWNGLAIAALAKAGAVFERADYVRAAESAFAFVTGEMAEGDRLRHSWCEGSAQPAELLDDYAQMARAAIALHEATGEADYLARAERWVGVLDRHYADREGGGYYLTPEDGEALLVRVKRADDHAQPSGNGTLVGVLASLAHLTGSEGYRETGERIVRTFGGGEAARHVVPVASLLNNAETLRRAVEVVIVGEREEEGARALLRAVRRAPVPALVHTVIREGEELSPAHPARGKGKRNGLATAYVCVGGTCSPPATDPESLRANLPAVPA